MYFILISVLLSFIFHLPDNSLLKGEPQGLPLRKHNRILIIENHTNHSSKK
ncbi:Uncharacterized protein dnl_39770 [Desulfonema limicola]|uniref:Uncharacterized protein n=1 Tax=Desulfonema limicola TaxID=45656 RepID=A0A975BAK4_9BACT|nr:Uncharacterized protein dnl_39770 [Desulfonema limicola]